MLLLKVAFRNLTRNRVRTLLNLTMAIGAFSSIVLFKGFSNYMMQTFERSLTRGQYGHIQIAKTAIWDGELPTPKENAYISDPADLRARLSQIPGVEYVGARANANVLLSSGDKSTGAWAVGFDNKIETSIENHLHVEEGAGFSKTQDFEILVSVGLQKQLNLKVGQTLTLVGQTLTGSMSSIEPEVRGIVRSGVADLDNIVVYLPLPAVQKLLGTSRVERLTVLLKDGEGVHLQEISDKVNEVLQKGGTQAGQVDSSLVTRTFKEIVTLYRQSTAFYAVQNLVVELILSGLIFFGILNTVGMSIYERIGEIGTMRALGDQRKEVLSLLLLEGLLLGLFGALLGVPIATAIASGFSALDVPLMMPGSSRTLPVHLHPAVADYIEASWIVASTCLISSLWPAQKAVRLSIVDALRANS